MAVIMISELPGAGPEFADVARQQGLFDQMKSAPVFMGHWSGATDAGYRVFEVWDSLRRSLSSAVGQRDTRMPKSHSLPLRPIDQHNGAVSAQEIDQYLDALEEPKRATLARLRQTILEILPGADQGISYGVPAFKVRGKAIAGFAAFKNHLSYLPHSGSVFPQLHDELEGYTTSSGALRFGIDEPLPVPLVEKLIAVRLQQAFPA